MLGSSEIMASKATKAAPKSKPKGVRWSLDYSGGEICVFNVTGDDNLGFTLKKKPMPGRPGNYWPAIRLAEAAPFDTDSNEESIMVMAKLCDVTSLKLPNYFSHS